MELQKIKNSIPTYLLYIYFCFASTVTAQTVQSLVTQDSLLEENKGEFTDIRDGKTYKTVTIGKQIWMAENLAYKPDSGKYWAYLNDDFNVKLYGYLYSWKAACSACPTGWHLPQQSEFNLLLNAFGGEGSKAYIALTKGGMSGFSIINCGIYYGNGFSPDGGGAAFWTSTERDKRTAFNIAVGGDVRKINLSSVYYRKKFGLSVRCIKDN